MKGWRRKRKKKWRTTEKSATAKDYPFTGLSIHVTRNGFNMFILHIYRIKVRNFFIICKFRNANKRKERKKSGGNMDVDTHLLKFLLCDSLFIPVYSLISSARRHLAFFLPLTLLLFFLSLSFFLAILFRMNNIFFFLLVLVQRTVQCCCSCVAKFKAKILTCFVLFRRFHFTVLFCTPYRHARLWWRRYSHGHTVSSVSFYIRTLKFRMQIYNTICNEL